MKQRFVCFTGFLVLAALSLPLAAQSYVVSKSASLSSAASVVTVQNTATNTRVVRITGAYVYCSIACSFTVERNGTAATGTALSVYGLSPSSPAAVVTAYHTSDVGSGTVLETFNVPAASSRSIPFLDEKGAGMIILPQGTSNNFTIRTSSISGTADIVISFTETPQ